MNIISEIEAIVKGIILEAKNLLVFLGLKDPTRRDQILPLATIYQLKALRFLLFMLSFLIGYLLADDLMIEFTNIK